MGHKGNVVIHENGRTQGGLDGYFVHDVPNIVASGPEFTIAWARQYIRNSAHYGRQIMIYDEIMTEGAILINLDDKELLFGSLEWIPSFGKFEDVPEELGEYPEYPDISRELLEVIQNQWPGWTVTLALPAEFATQETLLLRGQDLARPLITDTTAPESGWTKTQIREGFRQMFEMSSEPLKTLLREVKL